ncbi:BatD family protein [Robertkochia solimangrovi]|uniref:BatD family protein n=1 Tax=Robertkochia solimangrovi TaxID=2213046 RepID=UPI00117C097D|nr:BatD family protein [Robertkochia solimangrovi]TRZ42006.1 hypothetical protein DMZ48_15325 [Robertkochia solimangrovi]
MKIKTLKYFMLFFILLLSMPTVCSQQVWADLYVNKSEVLVGEPLDLKVTMYTSTFFSEGVNPGNIQIQGAFVVYLNGQSKSFRKNGNTYAGVTMSFKVFPFQSGVLKIPPLSFTVTSPSPGNYKGTPHKVSTDEKEIDVKPAPDEYNDGMWLVASSLTIRDRNAGEALKMKTGEVFERAIDRSASGTVGEMIPPVQWDTLPDVSLYPGRASVSTRKTKTAITGVRRESAKYLFEKAGTYELPEKVFQWYNPYTKKVSNRTLSKIIIDVIENEDSGILATVKDSLSVVTTSDDTEIKKAAVTIMGMTLKEFLLMLVTLLILLVISFKVIRHYLKVYRKRRAVYRNSEAWYFRRFLKNIKKRTSGSVINALYRWLDQTGTGIYDLESLGTYGNSIKLDEEIAKIADAINENKKEISLDRKFWKEFRKSVIGISPIDSSTGQWINP